MSWDWLKNIFNGNNGRKKKEPVGEAESPGEKKATIAGEVSITKITRENINSLYPLDNDDKDKLELKKMKAELLLLAKETSEKSFPASNGWVKLAKITSRLVAIGSLIAAIVYLGKPLYNYLESAGKNEEAHFNSEMIGIVKDIADTSKAKRARALNMLTTYDPETVIPFLLQEINVDPDNDSRTGKFQVSTEQILEAIKKMWRSLKGPTGFQKLLIGLGLSQSKKEIILAKINDNIRESFLKVQKFNENKAYVIELITWYLHFINQLCLTKEDAGITKQLDSLEKEAKLYVTTGTIYKDSFKSLIDQAKKCN